MPSETDPLRPNNPPAPEIVGYGYSRKPQLQDEEPQDHYRSHNVEISDHEASREKEAQAYTDISPLRTYLTIFSTVVCFGLVLSLLITGEWRKTAKVPEKLHRSQPSSIAARVEKLLSEHPLIGYLYSRTHRAFIIA